jgi:hypothetical protein
MVSTRDRPLEWMPILAMLHLIPTTLSIFISPDPPRRHLVSTASIQYPASNYSGPGSELDYFGTSGFSTPVSDLDLPSDNASEPSLDWDPSLASFFDSVDATALSYGSNCGRDGARWR